MTTPKGSGELRLVDGDIVDAVYVRLEGLSVITRMISEQEGTATFVPGAPAIMRRINVPTRALVEEARGLAERARELLARAGTLATHPLIVADGGSGSGDAHTAVDQHVMARLRVPATLDELLDELPHADATISSRRSRSTRVVASSSCRTSRHASSSAARTSSTSSARRRRARRAPGSRAPRASSSRRRRPGSRCSGIRCSRWPMRYRRRIPFRRSRSRTRSARSVSAMEWSSTSWRCPSCPPMRRSGRWRSRGRSSR